MDQMNHYLSIVRPGIEMIYFFSSVLIAIAAVIALRQIEILKTTLRVQSKRDALKLTSDQCCIYMSEIITLQNIFHKAVKDNSVKYFEGWNCEIKNNQISLSRITPPDTEGMKEVLHSLSVLNRMESFSSFFISNVADELVAYDTVGITYLNFVRYVLPWVLSCRKSGYYKNIVSLFILWETRRLNQELNKKKESLEKELSEMNFSSPQPIGVEDI
ncbi:hypothetical protein LQD23_15755 [Chromobacterium violaceum]|uniref:DUF4760 domain-containing protein n=1 Tax=Chromobacterium violaceum TaxID=536 RepID=UPI001E5970A3|nr:hypothetical protein [Chromobacterium violaceum]MCD0493742.1 hypothetical protein [Chromobacterium violaceum]